MLEFAGLPPLKVPTLPLGLHLAQKLHTYTRNYSGGRSSSRVKDLIDLVLIRSAAEFTAQEINDALTITFQTRGTHDLPPSVPHPPESWIAPYRSIALQIGLEPNVATGHQHVAEFLDPILAGSVAPDQIWNPHDSRWI